MKRYAAYSSIEFDYVQELPEGWQLLPNIAIFKRKVDRGHPNESLLSVSSYKGIVRQSEIENRKDRSSVDKSLYQLVLPGEIVYNPMLMWSRAIGYSPYRGIVSPDYAVITPKIAINPKYFHYQFRSDFYMNYSKQLSYGIVDSRLRLYYKYFKRMYSVVPPLEVQDTIVTYLDRKAERANDFIAKQTRLIEVLNEQKLAIINKAVTRGINPNAPMKDSGVEWLGEIPGNWNTTRLKYLCKNIVDCLHSTPEYTNNGDYPAIRTADITPGYLNLKGAKKVHSDTYNQRNIRLVPSSGDIIYSREGERFGIAAQVPEGAEVCLGQRVMLFRIHKSNSANFVMWHLNAESVYRQAQQDTLGSTSPHVNVKTNKDFVLSLPPLPEQNGIVDYIEDEIMRINTAISKAEKQIALANDYLNSLIFHTVTGQRVVPCE